MKGKYSLAQLHAIYCVYRDLDPGTRVVNCCTCGCSLHIEQVEDCYGVYGHFVERSLEPKLKFHPLNAFPQCPNCNMNASSSIKTKYEDYMKYRFGSNIKTKLLQDDRFNDFEFAKQWYIRELIEKQQIFPELASVTVDIATGELFDVEEIENNIEKQWNTFSKTFKQDLDELVRILGTEPIEYERF